MTKLNWYSASLVFAILEENTGLWRRVTSVVLIRADGFDMAFNVACQRGFESETTYRNPLGEQVRWAFERVATLDALPEVLTNGVEVYSAPHDVADDSEISFDAVFEPSQFPPEQTGISPT